MKNNNQNKEKRVYIAPILERIQLDSEISLALASFENPDPPTDPTGMATPNYFNNDPFKTNLT